MILQRSANDYDDTDLFEGNQCLAMIAHITKEYPKSILHQGCKTEITMLCGTRNLNVLTLLDTGCWPKNYISLELFKKYVNLFRDFLVEGPEEKVQMATHGELNTIDKHIELKVRHVDQRGKATYATLKFGVLAGLRFPVVIGFEAICRFFNPAIRSAGRLATKLATIRRWAVRLRPFPTSEIVAKLVKL
jgi:hypothetical protein